MAEYQRFISYMYAYTQDEKKENVGFAKVEVRGDQQQIQITLKGIPSVEMLNVCGFVRENDQCICILLGRMLTNHGNGQFTFNGKGEALPGSTYRFDQLAGLVVVNQAGQAYATVWDDEPFGLSMFTAPLVVEETAQEAAEQADDSEVVLEAAEVETLVTEGEQQAEETLQEDGISAAMVNHHEERERLWENLKNRYAPITPFSEGEGIECLKALPADLGKLPRQNWMYANNGFVMHGYIQYRYIIFARLADGELILGVPGADTTSERMMAEMFGFGQFKPISREDEQAGALGYWYVPIVGVNK